MNNLKRVKTTDLQVLRSILNEETLTNTNENVFSENQLFESTSSDNRIENKTTAVNDENRITNKEKSLYKKKIIQTHDKPFMFTRIESKHKFCKTTDNQTRENISIYSDQPKSPSVPIYKSVHYKNIINTENRLNRKYEELAKLLNEEILIKTASLCDQSINEARQLIQNSLATSRIVSSFLTDMSESGRKVPVANFFEKFDQISPEIDGHLCHKTTNTINGNSFNNFDVDGKQNFDMENINQHLISKTGSIIDRYQSTNVDIDIEAITIHNPPVDNFAANLFGMSATTSKLNMDQKLLNSRKFATDHVLDSNEPFIRCWLSNKNRQMKLERRFKREEMKIERAISTSAIAVKEQRKTAAEEAFKIWVEEKKLIKPIKVNEKEESTETESEISPVQAGRQPRPSQTFQRRSKTMLRPKSCASFSINKDAKMKLLGQHMSILSNNFPQYCRCSTKIDYSKYVTKRDARNVRPETAIPQSRKKNLSLLTMSSESPLNTQQKKVKKLKKKKKKIDLKDSSTSKEDNKPHNIYSDEFSDDEKEVLKLDQVKVSEKKEFEILDDFSLSNYDSR